MNMNGMDKNILDMQRSKEEVSFNEWKESEFIYGFALNCRSHSQYIPFLIFNILIVI